MTGPTHIVIGLATAVAYTRANGMSPGPLGLLVLLAGALAPDIDGDGSITRPGSLLGRFLPRGARLMLNELTLVVNGIIKMLFNHRGFFHWLLIPATIIFCGLYFHRPYVFYFGLGYLSHILADCCTKGGVELFQPFTNKNISITRLKTGSSLEGVLCCLLLALVCLFGFGVLPETTQEGFRTLFGSWPRQRDL